MPGCLDSWQLWTLMSQFCWVCLELINILTSYYYYFFIINHFINLHFNGISLSSFPFTDSPHPISPSSVLRLTEIGSIKHLILSLVCFEVFLVLLFRCYKVGCFFKLETASSLLYLLQTYYAHLIISPTARLLINART